TYAGSGSGSALLSAFHNTGSMDELCALITTHFGTVTLTDRFNSNSVNETKTNKQPPVNRQSKLQNPHLQCSNPNCLKKGHMKEWCWAKGGGQEGKGPVNKNNRDSNLVKQSDSNGQTGKNASVNQAQANLSEFHASTVDATAWIATTAYSESDKPKEMEW